jgi:hypothetical protein
MPTYLTVIIGVTALTVSLFLVIHTVGGIFRKNLERVVSERFNPTEVLRKDLWANYFGRKSKGTMQIRGNGALVLTNAQLWFLKAVPRTEIDIPLNQIIRVSTTQSHLGKTIFRPLLFVEFETADGPDSIAWALRKPDAWVRAIEAARTNVSTNAT